MMENANRLNLLAINGIAHFGYCATRHKPKSAPTSARRSSNLILQVLANVSHYKTPDSLGGSMVGDTRLELVTP